MYFNNKGENEVTYDAIVVGSGISGGVAAKELCENGLKTLVLERGRNVRHPQDYTTANLDAWDMPNRGRTPQAEIDKHYEKQSRTGYTISESTKHFFVKDDENPYTEIKRFDWMRGYHVGGRSLLWGRQSYRWSDIDFEANKKEGIAIDWPIRYADIQPWYDHVEKYVGVSGMAEGLPQLPDSNFLKPMELTCSEQHLRNSLAEKYDDRILTIGRTAHLTEQLEGRGLCQYRNRCMRGCPYGGYFSSNAVTLPMAEKTGNMTLRPNSIVHSIIYDPQTGKAKGVRVVDAETKETHEFFSKVVFLNASAFGSTFILMNSKEHHPNGLGNGSDQLGRNVMDHHFLVGAGGKLDGYEDKYVKGNRPNGFYIPRFRNLGGKTNKDFVRGYGYQGGGSRDGWGRNLGAEAALFGVEFKEELMKPGGWGLGMNGFGEMLPYEDNRITLNEDLKDIYDMPTLTMDVEIKENERKMRVDMKEQAAEMLENAGFKDVTPWEREYGPGLGIHEMGTARMGHDPKTSVLNKWNQVHECPNVYVTDGACMTSASCVNPSLTYMALTARAADHAAKSIKNENL